MHYNLINLTPEQRKLRTKLLIDSDFTMAATPVGFSTFKDDLYGDLDSFLEYYESGNASADYDALIAFQTKEFNQHCISHRRSYRNQIAVIPGQDVSESDMPENQSPT
jgi:hypothetical protein